MLRVPKDIALKMLINVKYFLQKTFIDVCNIFGSKTPKTDLSTLKYGLFSCLTTLST